MTDAGVLTNPLKLDQVIRAIGGALTVDTNGVPLEDDLSWRCAVCGPTTSSG